MKTKLILSVMTKTCGLSFTKNLNLNTLLIFFSRFASHFPKKSTAHISKKIT